MGTNFYFKPDNDNAIHMGKRTKFKTRLEFTFRGYDTITSYSHWRNILTTIPGEIIDEYGASQDMCKFIKFLDSLKATNKFVGHSDHEPDVWQDAEFYTFSGEEFC